MCLSLGISGPAGVVDPSSPRVTASFCWPGPPERQRGFLQRQGWLDVLELQGAAVGMNDRELEEARRVDEGSIPVEDVGVFVKINVVWAVKAGSRS